MVNVFSVDLEDYFHPTEVGQGVADWAHFAPRIELGANLLLDLLAEHNTRATFFVLGWVADRHPQLVKRIADAGHEIGCHSYHHRLVYNLTPDEFREDTRRAMRVIEDVLGVSPKLYRAPNYSIVSKSFWALEILAELGFTHDSSVYPIVHDRYGIPGFGRHARPIRTPSGSIMEVPIATVQLSAKRVTPVGGGAYLRLFPYRYTAAGIRRLNNVEQQPACVYTHPWELDPDQPRMARALISSLRTYSGLRSMPHKVRRLSEEFEFSAMGDVHPHPQPSAMLRKAAEIGSKAVSSASNPNPVLARGIGSKVLTSMTCNTEHFCPETAPLLIREATEQDNAAWDEFVKAHPHGTPFHLMAWRRSIEETFGFQPQYRLAIERARIRGVLPMFLVKNFVLGSALISIPFATYGGILADTPMVRDVLGADAKSLGESLAVGYIELRNAHSEQCAGFERISRYATFVQAVGPDEGALLQALPANMRSKVRRALKRGFSTRRQTTDLRAFTELHAANYRRLGTPSFPVRHYAALLRNFGDGVDIREVVLDDMVVAASMNFFSKDQVHSFYVASDDRYHEALPNNYLYFDNMRWAGQNGYRYFDFGRSKKETGTYEFKRRWGIVPRELPYEILLIRRKDLPNFSPMSPRFQMAIRMWKKIPLPLTRILGPRLIRLFP